MFQEYSYDIRQTWNVWDPPLTLRLYSTVITQWFIWKPKDQREACHCLPVLTSVLHTWAALTDVRTGVPSPPHAIHGAAVVSGATGYQIWRRGRAAWPRLGDTCQSINWPDVTFRHPWVTHSRSGAWCWSGEYPRSGTGVSKGDYRGFITRGWTQVFNTAASSSN